MKIPQSKIDEITSSIDIVDVISAVTPLRKAGRSFMGRCPFHEERSPSFSVSQEKGVYHCFGCGKSGNVFTFVMETENVTFFDAVKILADKAGIQLEYENEPYDPDRNKIEVLYEINKQAGKYFYDNLLSRSGELAREYLKQRGLKDDMIKKFGLGYSLREKDALYNHFQNDFSEEDLIASGMVLNIAAKELRDRFRGRLMFPVFNESGKVIAFGGRRMYDEGSDEAKYINSPETRIYNKSKTLYGLNFAKQKIKETGYVILVEGYMDLISLFQYGIENVVASSGTSLTNLHVKILSRYTKEVVIVFDSDLAGQNASRRAIELIIENDMSVGIVALPLGYDPDTYIKKFSAEAFYNLLNNRKSIIDYIGESYKESGKLETPEGKTEFVREIIGLIAKMRNEIKRDFYIKDIAERFSIYESIIRKELAQSLKLKSKGLTREVMDRQDASERPKENTGINADTYELSLIKMFYFGDQDTKDYIMNNLELNDLKSSATINVINYLINSYTNFSKININETFTKFREGEENKIIGNTLLDESYVNIGEKNYINDVKSLFKQFAITKSYRRMYLKDK
jgi:DNA primase